MPTYSFRCPHCETEQELFCRVSELDNSVPYCCGKKTTQIFTHAPYGYVQTDCHYVCPVTREGVTSYRQRKNIMAEHNLLPADGMDPEKTIARVNKEKADSLKLAAGMPLSHKSLPEVI